MIKNFLNKKNIIVVGLIGCVTLVSSGILFAANKGYVKEFGTASLLPTMGWLAKKQVKLKEQEIDNLKKIIALKEQETNKELDEVSRLRATLVLKDNEIEVKNTEIVDLKNQITLKEKNISGKVEEIRKLASRMGKMEKETKAKESENNDLQNKFSLKDEEKSKEMSGWQEKVSEKEKQVLEKEKELLDKDKKIVVLENKMSLKSTKSEKNPILSAETDSIKWDNQKHIAGNCLVKDQAGATYLFYYANRGGRNTESGRDTAVGMAKSNDNINFQKYPQPVLLPGEKGEWDSGGVEVHPSCIIQRRDGTYSMYYSGYIDKKGVADFYWGSNGGIGVAFSKDLINWKKYDKNPILTNSKEIAWESEGIFEPSVIFTGDEYGGDGAFLMWYGGNNKDGVMGIGLAKSINGIDWIKHSNNPVLTRSSNSLDFDGYTVEVHNVLKINNGYVMAYEATDRKFPSPFRIGLAFSKDGVTWEKNKFNPLLEGGGIGEWDSMGAYHPSILIEDNKILIFYVGLNSNYDHQIGVAEINPAYFNFD